ncbi:MFS transporter [Pseudohongiella acticola]|uniref:MFS transporter n=1 Tax=Pseudohongiella acticola TaxID=1524254 RepID=UPI0011130517|nr:MFS transporter [Pseudohongiella acticola]
MTGYLVFLRQHWALLGFGFTAVFWGNFGQSFFVAWFGADIQRTLGLSAGEYGTAYSLATLVSAATVVWAGGLIDRLPLRSYAVAVALGLAVALTVLSQANGLVTLLIGFFLLRLFGQSLLPHGGMTSMSRYFVAERGKAISVAMSGVPLGEIVLPLMAVAMIAAIGWQASFGLIAIAAVVVLIPFMLWLLKRSNIPATPPMPARQPGQTATDVDNGGAGRREMLRDYRFWLALPGLMANPFLITGVFIHQNFLVTDKGWSLSWLATCFIVYGAVHWVSSLVSGVLVDRFKGPRLVGIFLLPMLLSMLIAALMPGDLAALLMLALLGMSAGSSPPITGSLWPEIYGTRKLGAIRSMMMAIMVLATAISPVLFGYFIDHGVDAYGLFGVCAVYVFFASLLMMASYPKNPTPVPGAE